MNLITVILGAVLLPTLITHRYPVHYDGPFLQHAQFGARPATSGRLPAFDVKYHGGPVEPATKTYAIYWYPKSSPGSYATLIDGFLGAIGGTSYYAVAASYSTKSAPIQNASTFEADYVDTDAFPKTLDVSAIETELSDLVAKSKVPAASGDPIFVFLPQGAPFKVTSPSVCALHSAFEYQNKSRSTVVFAVVPYQGGNVACEAYRAAYGLPNKSVPGGDPAITNASRELLEMVTDPLGNGWYDKTYGEIGDICFFDYGDQGFLSDQANYMLAGKTYQLPEAFEQSAAACRPNLGGGS